jgi:RNA polymerase sigma-70 factor (ECF subfamily)
MPDAEDAVQDALLSVYEHLGQFRGQAQLSTWLTTIVTNAALMKLRLRDSYLSLDEDQGEDGLTFLERLADSKPSPENVSSVAQRRDQLVEVVRQLSPKLRRTLQLRDIDGLTTKEAALVLGIPYAMVKAQLARARAKLARIAQMKPIRRQPGTVSTSKAAPAKGLSEHWALDEASKASAISCLPEEAK